MRPSDSAGAGKAPHRRVRDRRQVAAVRKLEVADEPDIVRGTTPDTLRKGGRVIESFPGRAAPAPDPVGAEQEEIIGGATMTASSASRVAVSATQPAASSTNTAASADDAVSDRDKPIMASLTEYRPPGVRWGRPIAQSAELATAGSAPWFGRHCLPPHPGSSRRPRHRPPREGGDPTPRARGGATPKIRRDLREDATWQCLEDPAG